MTVTIPFGVPAIGAAPHEPHAEIIDITPAMAQAYLEANTHNRPLADYRVEQFARDMTNDDWQVTGEAIKFDVNGTLLDGQHRLWACVQSNASFRTYVITGLPPESQEVMDTGQKRTMGQVLGLRGYGNPNHLASVAMMVHQWSTGEKFKDISKITARTVTHAEISRVLDANPGIGDAIAFAQARPIAGTTLSARSFALFLLSKIDKDAAEEFFADLSEMRTSGHGDPKAALLKRLTSAVAENERLDRYTQALMIIRVWNAVRKGEQLHRVNVRVRGEQINVQDPI